ncbi:MAG: pilus assembly protein PilP [Thermodesulfobacteriota bacterium]
MKRKRKKRKSLRGWVTLACLMGAGVVPYPVCATSGEKKAPQVEDLVEFPAKTTEYSIDVKKLPDPFLSYFIRREQMAGEKAEAERRKQLEAEARLERKKREARERLEDLKKARTELQTLKLSQLTLTAIIQSSQGHWAMVRDPKGQGYILKKGIRIGTEGGIVSRIAINDKKVIVKEPYIAEDEIHIKYKPVEIALPDELY